MGQGQEPPRALDIVVTHYREPWEVGKPLFDLLALQRGVDFGQIRVILVNDGEGHEIDGQLLAGYPYTVEQVTIPHGGISAARNAGIDHATAKWINFCDFDDGYVSIYALRDVLQSIRQAGGNYDILWAHLLMQDFREGKDVLRWAEEKINWVFTHGKYYRLAWLRENRLRFRIGMDFQEDSEFNAFALAVADYKRIGEIRTPVPIYVYCCREESVTHVPGIADRANWMQHLRNVHVCEMYRERGLPDWRVTDMVVRTTYDAYLMVNSVREISQEMKRQIVAEYRRFMRDFGRFYGVPRDDILPQIEEVARKELMDRPVPYSFDIVTMWKDIVTGEIKKGE